MTADKTLNEQILRNLRETLDRVHRDIEKMDIWAGALSAFLQPIPDYPMAERFLLPACEPSERPPARDRSRGHPH